MLSLHPRDEFQLTQREAMGIVDTSGIDTLANTGKLQHPWVAHQDTTQTTNLHIPDIKLDSAQ